MLTVACFVILSICQGTDGESEIGTFVEVLQKCLICLSSHVVGVSGFVTKVIFKLATCQFRTAVILYHYVGISFSSSKNLFCSVILLQFVFMYIIRCFTKSQNYNFKIGENIFFLLILLPL